MITKTATYELYKEAGIMQGVTNVAKNLGTGVRNFTGNAWNYIRTSPMAKTFGNWWRNAPGTVANTAGNVANTAGNVANTAGNIANTAGNAAKAAPGVMNTVSNYVGQNWKPMAVGAGALAGTAWLGNHMFNPYYGGMMARNPMYMGYGYGYGMRPMMPMMY